MSEASIMPPQNGLARQTHLRILEIDERHRRAFTFSRLTPLFYVFLSLDFVVFDESVVFVGRVAHLITEDSDESRFNAVNSPEKAYVIFVIRSLKDGWGFSPSEPRKRLDADLRMVVYLWITY